MSVAEHKGSAHSQEPVKLAIVTVSDTRTPETDQNGRYLKDAALAAGYVVAAYRLIPDEASQVSSVLDELASGDAQVMIWNGGTGISSRDTTYDVLSRKLEKILPGFGELFRMLSYQEIGSAAMLSRAVGGTYRGRVVVSVPGSPAAVRLAWEKLIVPELEHLAWEVAR